MGGFGICFSFWPFCDMAWDANEGRFKSRSGHQRAGRAKPVYEFTP
jgi:hypothetical protein